MAIKSTGILFDINQFLPFKLDENMKKKICFSETLLISYIHNKTIQPPINKNLKVVKSGSGEDDTWTKEDFDVVKEHKTPTLSDDDFFFYFYDQDLPKKKTMMCDNIISVDDISAVKPKRKKGKCACLENSAMCKCDEVSYNELSLKKQSDLSLTSESDLSKSEVIVMNSQKCKCSSTDKIKNVCKCGFEIEQQQSSTDKLSQKSQSKFCQSDLSESGVIEFNSNQCKCSSTDKIRNVCKCGTEVIESKWGETSNNELSQKIQSELSLTSESDLSRSEIQLKSRQCICSSIEIDKLKRGNLSKILSDPSGRNAFSEAYTNVSTKSDKEFSSSSTKIIPSKASMISRNTKDLSYSFFSKSTTTNEMSSKGLSLTTESTLSDVSVEFSEKNTSSYSHFSESICTNESSKSNKELSLTTESTLSEGSSEFKDLSYSLNSSISDTSSNIGSLKQSFEGSSDYGDCLKTFITPENCTTTGGLTFNVETIGINNDRFLITASSQYNVEGFDTGYDLVSTVDLNLHTLEENRQERRKNETELNENLLYIAVCDGGYFCSTTKKEKESKNMDSKYFSYNDAFNFVLEGAIIILLRYIAMTQYQGKVRTTYVDIYGNIGESVFKSKMENNAIINDKEMTVLKVSRTNLNSLGFETSECYVFTLSGYLVQHQWSDNNIVVHINPMLPIDPATNDISRQIPMRNNWREDMLLLSNYFDFKDRQLMENESYLAGKVQLQSILTDYFQTILLMKPRQVIPFTRRFFASFSKSITIPHNAYFDKNCQRVRYSYL